MISKEVNIYEAEEIHSKRQVMFSSPQIAALLLADNFVSTIPDNQWSRRKTDDDVVVECLVFILDPFR